MKIRNHDDVINQETFSALLAICAGNQRSLVKSPHKSQWRGALIFSLFCAWINGWVNNREAGDLRHHRAHYNFIVMINVNVLEISRITCIVSYICFSYISHKYINDVVIVSQTLFDHFNKKIGHMRTALANKEYATYAFSIVCNIVYSC